MRRKAGLEQSLPDEEEGHQAAPAAGAVGFAEEERKCRRPWAWRRQVRTRRSRERGEKRAGEPGDEACGPPMALMTRELTTKGPMPTISIM